MKLFTIPYSGGNSYSYSQFREYLPEDIELCNLELPGRGTRINEPLLYSADEITEDLYCQIKNDLDEDYAIFGHSVGSLLAATLSRHIANNGSKLPSVMFISGLKAISQIKYDERYLLPDDAFINVLREMGGTPEELLADESFMAFLLPIVRADFQVYASYKYMPSKPKLNIPMVILYGNQEHISHYDAALWQEETLSEFSIHQFEGKHFFIFEHTRDVCSLIARKMLKM